MSSVSVLYLSARQPCVLQKVKSVLQTIPNFVVQDQTHAGIEFIFLTTLTFQAAIETCTILISLDPDPMWVKLCDLYHPKEFLSFVPLFKPVKVNIYQSFTIQSRRDGKVSNLNDKDNSKKSENWKPINLIYFYRQSLFKL